MKSNTRPEKVEPTEDGMERSADGSAAAGGGEAAPSRREFFKLSSLALGALALVACDDELVAAPKAAQPGIAVVPTDDMQPETTIQAPLAIRSDSGDWLSFVGPEAIYFWPDGGGGRGPRFVLSTSRTGLSGGYGLQLDRPAGDGAPLEVIYSVDGVRTWETGLDFQEDASGLGIGPDFVLAYDNSDPPGDRFRMAPGGHTLHSPLAGTPSTAHRFHIVGGNAETDRAWSSVLYLQSGSVGNPGRAGWLVRGQARDPDTGEWGQEVFGVSVNGGITAKSSVLSVAGGNERDVLTLVAEGPGDRAWARFVSGESEWRAGVDGESRALAFRFGDHPRVVLGAEGRIYAEQGMVAFSPSPPLDPAAMTPRDWVDWAAEDAARPAKPYPGIPDTRHPDVLRRAAATGREASDIADEDARRYGRDVSKMATGVARWAVEVQDALERADSFEEFRARLARRRLG